MPTMLPPPLLLLLAAIVPIVTVSSTTVERFGLYEGSLPGVVAHCVLVLAVTTPLAIFGLSVIEPTWQRVSARLLDAVLGPAVNLKPKRQ